jgi:abortive infection bacteriophage resistance protein
MTLKSHHTYQHQIALLKERGLAYSNYNNLMQMLKTIGYYRLSAYTYPLRKAIYDNRGRVISRQDDFESGATIEHARDLYLFDQRLRLQLQDALEVIEVAFCAQVAYVLGRRSPDAHINPHDLDGEFCQGTNHRGQPRHQEWLRRYEKLKHNARYEDYVQHHRNSYQDNIPIWVATEFMDFGTIVTLFEMMKKEDQIEIAQVFGLKNDQSGIMHSWMLALNDLRNRCAHNNRVWNRISRSPKKPSVQMTTVEFHHFDKLNETQQKNLYGVVSVISYLIRRIDPGSKWHIRAKNDFESFGNVFGITLENTMGFPEDWQREALWN